ncbi:hypothetical protein Vadar_034721 [Vaccinium darrowii]|uniref:Uncharacterized protein n=1 Tax=Vaccinium darrowii TaxID=229202 RepID=A0ACB7Y3X0_9ERIC|nr:hypothetical protein Vadar_034721 [Vaccinium darrowii]
MRRRGGGAAAAPLMEAQIVEDKSWKEEETFHPFKKVYAIADISCNERLAMVHSSSYGFRVYDRKRMDKVLSENKRRRLGYLSLVPCDLSRDRRVRDLLDAQGIA